MTAVEAMLLGACTDIALAAGTSLSSGALTHCSPQHEGCDTVVCALWLRQHERATHKRTFAISGRTPLRIATTASAAMRRIVFIGTGTSCQPFLQSPSYAASQGCVTPITR